MSITLNSNFSIHDFNALESVSKRGLYQEANETHNIDLVRELNNLGMKPEVPSYSGPTIISNYMDIATKYDKILGFLKELRKTNRLLTEKEFQPLSTKKWIKKNDLCRILGADHLARTISENQLKHIKVPLKFAVVEDTEQLKIMGYDYGNNLYALSSDHIKIYAEEIRSEYRKLSRDEIDELIQVVAAANFLDLWPQNVVVAEDGIYFIDTEFKSFAGSIEWEKMKRFESLINEQDLEYFRTKVEQKIKEPKARQEDEGYESLVDRLEMLNELSLEKYKNKIEEIKGKMSNLGYVGAKVAGRERFKPNIFSFMQQGIFS